VQTQPLENGAFAERADSASGQNCANPSCPLVIAPESADELLEEWLVRHRAAVSAQLLTHKALLFRGFENRGGIGGIADTLFATRLSYTYRSTPRTDVGELIYTATEYPKQLWIPQHNENAFQRSWPMKLLFHCMQPATTGGRTPLAETARVTLAIDAQVQEEFDRKQVKYVRNYRPGVDLPWQDVFGTTTKEGVEQFCRAHRIAFEWVNNGCLRTSQVCQAFAVHPVIGQRLWFNQAHLFHVSALDPAARAMMLSLFGEDGLPRNSYFGDGSAIPADVLEHIRTAFDRNKILFQWQANDILLVDNMQMSHGREPYDGPRRVLVCMSEPYSAADLIDPTSASATKVAL